MDSSSNKLISNSEFKSSFSSNFSIPKARIPTSSFIIASWIYFSSKFRIFFQAFCFTRCSSSLSIFCKIFLLDLPTFGAILQARILSSLFGETESFSAKSSSFIEAHLCIAISALPLNHSSLSFSIGMKASIAAGSSNSNNFLTARLLIRMSLLLNWRIVGLSTLLAIAISARTLLFKELNLHVHH